MTDETVTPEPWPSWLEGLSPEDRVLAIMQALADCCFDNLCHGSGDHRQGSEQHITTLPAVALLRRLLDEARQQAPVPSADPYPLPGSGVTLWHSVSSFEAVQVTEGCDLDAIAEWCGGARAAVTFDDGTETEGVRLLTRHGHVTATEGDWISLDQMPPQVWAETAFPQRFEPARPQAPVPSAEHSQAIAALTRLALEDPLTDWVPGNHAYLALEAEMTARREHAAGALETIARLAVMPEPPREPQGGNPAAEIPPGAMDLLESAWELICFVPHEHSASAVRWEDRYRALVAGYAAAKAGKVAEAEPEPEPPLPPGQFARVELMGHNPHTGWVTDGTRAGVPVMVISDWDGLVIAEAPGASLYRYVPLPTPQKRPEPQKAITGTGDTFGFAGDVDDDDDPDDSYGMPF